MTTMQQYLQNEHGAEDDEFFHRRVGEYHASMSKNCVRRNYLDYTEGSRPGEDAWPHFQLGNVLEEEFLDALRNEFGWRNVKNSIPIEVDLGNFKIVGETDPVVVKPNLELEQLYEVKTTKNVKYVRNEPKIEHVYQVHCYMRALDTDTTKIVYIQKTDLETVEHVIEFDEDIWIDIVMRFSQLHRALKNDEIPPPTKDEDDQDYFCSFSEDGRCCKNL